MFGGTQQKLSVWRSCRRQAQLVRKLGWVSGNLVEAGYCAQTGKT